MDRCDKDIEGPGDFADGLSFFFNELTSENALLRTQFVRTVESDVACLGRRAVLARFVWQSASARTPRCQGRW